MAPSIESLQAKRRLLFEQLAQVGDMRRGSITEVYRPCGKQRCCCKESGHPGHGPYYAYTIKVGGTTKTLQLRPGPLLSKIEREVQAHRRFRQLSEELLAVNEAICEARPLERGDEDMEAVKKTLRRRSSKKLPKR